MADRPPDQSGVLLVDKPMEWTSHDVVKFVRGFGLRKVGHCGTLDPRATGLLVLVIGRATKLSDRFSGQAKEYEGTMELGKETFSQDADGKVTAEYDWSHVTEQMVRDTSAEFVGDLMQIPPMVSAVKKNGKKLYEMARKGIVIERDPRPITITELTITHLELPEISFQIACSKGTYVRTLCADIGTKLKAGAYLKALRRLKSGAFTIDQAVTLEEIRTWNREQLYENFLPLEKALSFV
jgi:tRNA pseudouridine55 synthase